MGMIQTTPITGPSAWTAADFANDDSWIMRLSEAEIAEIDAALASLRAAGKGFPKFGREDFPLPALAVRLAEITEELENGRGFVLLRGLKPDRYSDEEINAIYYGMGLNMGQPVGQNPKGDLLGKVMHVGDASDKNNRVY